MIEIKSLKELFNPDLYVENLFLAFVLAIFLSLYGPKLHTKLPESLKSLFDNPMFRVAVLFLAAYMAKNDFNGALVLTIIFLLSMNIIQSHNVIARIKSKLNMVESFENMGPPVANCNTYNTEEIKKNGMPFYPLNDSEKNNQINLG
jgi:hypothetical protein